MKKAAAPVKLGSLHERMDYRVAKQKNKRVTKGKKTYYVRVPQYPCSCGCGKKVVRLFARGHVSRFVKILTDESFEKAVQVLKDVRARIVPEKLAKKKAAK